MNENVVEILIYLYENYMDGDEAVPTDQDAIHDDLLQAGFQDLEIEKAFQWMDELVLRQGDHTYPAHAEHSVRIFSAEEMVRLDRDSRGFLMYLEQNQILDPVSRELVLDRAMALEGNDVGIDELKWVALMVLINHPGSESAFAQMEDLVYNELPAYIH